MKNNTPLFVALMPAVLLVITSCREGTMHTQGPFIKHRLPIDERVSDLISQMTLA